MRIALAALVLVSQVSFAQTSSGAEKRQVVKTTTVVFDENDVVNGELQGPNGQVVTAGPDPVFPSLIRVRQNFSDKLMQSVQNLR